jgi:hypothetical protein
MMYDYPYIMAFLLQEIRTNGVVKCIYREMRINNRTLMKDTFGKFKEKCKNEKEYN